MSDRDFIVYGAPTLANIKTASLFNCRFDTKEHFQEWMRQKNRAFHEKGLCMYVLHYCRHSALVYFFRMSRLSEVLQREEVRSFLAEYGYGQEDSVPACLTKLKERTDGCRPADFPHEIGIFLGYPLDDVRGFIDNHGENYQAFGMWKVYGNVEETCACFRLYRQCSDVYERIWRTGRRNLSDLTVKG